MVKRLERDRMRRYALAMDRSNRLAAYLERIGLEAPPSRDAAGLARLLAAHRQAIAFENLDIPLGRGIAIDGDSVFAKLVERRRGGYCFEQNRLLSDMLLALGFHNRPLLARVWLGAADDAFPPRTHVTMDDGPWLADGGFGGSFVPPLPLRDGAEAQSPDGASHRVRALGQRGTLTGEWTLERAGPHTATDGRAAPHGEWQSQYAFDLSEVAPADLEQANHWTATRPDTRFTTLHIASRVLPDGFAALTDRELSVHRGGGSEKRAVAGACDYRETLADVFGIALSPEEVARLPLFGD